MSEGQASLRPHSSGDSSQSSEPQCEKRSEAGSRDGRESTQGGPGACGEAGFLEEVLSPLGLNNEDWDFRHGSGVGWARSGSEGEEACDI